MNLDATKNKVRGQAYGWLQALQFLAAFPVSTGLLRTDHTKPCSAMNKAFSLKCYQQRNNILRGMGFESYAKYLQSNLWSDLRWKKLASANYQCEACGGAATQVHHKKYTFATLSGGAMWTLFAICRNCHEECEFDMESKVSLNAANHRLAAIAYRHGRTIKGFCSCCGRVTGMSQTVCPPCSRLPKDQRSTGAEPQKLCQRCGDSSTVGLELCRRCAKETRP